MSVTFKRDYDTWEVRLGSADEAGDCRTLLFFSTSNDQRPYRVLEVEPGAYGSESDLAALDDSDLIELFDRSRSMGYPKSYPTYTA